MTYSQEWKGSYSSEVVPERQQMWRDANGTLCLGDIEFLDETVLPQTNLLLLALPCTGMAVSGKRLGNAGPTGHLVMRSVRKAVCMQVGLIWIETSIGALKTQGGKIVRQAMHHLRNGGYSRGSQIGTHSTSERFFNRKKVH